MAECLVCAEGFYTPAIGSSACSICSPGYRCQRNQSIACIQGKYQDMYGAILCKDCPVGWYGVNETNKTQCYMGREGHYTLPTITKLCPMGKYQKRNASSSCNDCAHGMYANTTGATDCKACEKGHSCTASSMERCVPGKFNMNGR